MNVYSLPKIYPLEKEFYAKLNCEIFRGCSYISYHRQVLSMSSRSPTELYTRISCLIDVIKNSTEIDIQRKSIQIDAHTYNRVLNEQNDRSWEIINKGSPHNMLQSSSKLRNGLMYNTQVIPRYATMQRWSTHITESTHRKLNNMFKFYILFFFRENTKTNQNL